ncbi:hypothetical protein SAMN05216188_12340 [Lentzea xinjiangensis]|uniref:AAA ATPase domain-containing protein n=1 Tax=Lentzea xinjiangensis TaxID=402600 RepID=A0A1H9UYJ2_9PSEU|nr:hypothetical protein SAMN05216188_12340 [Lentzea xinjiangensis]
MLRDELATGPGAELDGAHAALLDEPPAATSHRTGPVQAELPGNAPGLTGRSTEPAALDRLLAERDLAAPAVVAVCGTAGVGRTALTVHWGHRLRAAFPDGQLYGNLRGDESGKKPVATADVLGGFLEALGIAGSAVPADVDAGRTRRSPASATWARRYGEAAALSTPGRVEVHLGHPQEATGLPEEAVEIFRSTGHRYGERTR